MKLNFAFLVVFCGVPAWALSIEGGSEGFLSAAGPSTNLTCVKWRRTLKCSPSGPRDPMSDKDCDYQVMSTEAGFCECEGFVHTQSVGCGHPEFKCADECSKVQRLWGEVFGAGAPGETPAAAAPPAVPPTGTAYAADADPYTKARLHGAQAVKAVNEAVSSANAGLDAAKQMIQHLMSLSPWTDIAKAGKQAEDAGIQAQELAKMARPFIYGQVNATRRTIVASKH